MPRGRSPKVDHIRESFLASIESATKLYDQVQLVGTIRPSATCPKLHTEHVRRVIELAFLGVVAAWEEFLEQTMVRYMAGAQTANGFKPALRIGKCQDIPHAYQVYSGDPQHDPEKHYLTWSNPGEVTKLAGLFFENGEPYASAFQGKSPLLNDAVRIRNRVAHSSEKCRADFKDVARRFLNTATLRQSYRVGDLLLERAARHFGQTAVNNRWTFFHAYMEIYKELAKQIVPN